MFFRRRSSRLQAVEQAPVTSCHFKGGMKAMRHLDRPSALKAMKQRAVHAEKAKERLLTEEFVATPPSVAMTIMVDLDRHGLPF